MGNIRFRRTVRLSRMLYLNVSKTGFSLSVAGRLFRLTFGKGGVRFSSGLRGTGLSYTDYKKYKN